jgi:hypothetical protein
MKPRMTAILAFLLLALSATHATVANAWDADGHRLVCALAYANLSDAGRQFVKDTLGATESADDDIRNAFAESCTWPDKARFEDYKGSYEAHFINVPRDAKGIDFARDCAAMDCIAVALQRSLTYLSRPADGNRERERKAAALKFLGHFIADLHQPLHVAHGEDLGGNRIQVKWFGADSNLHRVWDSGITEKAGITWPDSLKVLAEMHPELGSRNVLAWMRESFLLARSHAYANVSGQPIIAGDTLDDAYLGRSKPVVMQQLARAGVRLTFLIEGLAKGTAETNILMQ